jgi:hypothetical protein
VVFLGSRANAELVLKFHVALHASHAAPPNGNIEISPCTKVTLILTLSWITLFMGDMGEGGLHREDEVTVEQRNSNLVMGHIGGPAPRQTGRQTAGRNVT